MPDYVTAFIQISPAGRVTGPALPPELAGEIRQCLGIVKTIFGTLGMTDYRVRLSMLSLIHIFWSTSMT